MPVKKQEKVSAEQNSTMKKLQTELQGTERGKAAGAQCQPWWVTQPSTHIVFDVWKPHRRLWLQSQTAIEGQGAEQRAVPAQVGNAQGRVHQSVKTLLRVLGEKSNHWNSQNP